MKVLLTHSHTSFSGCISVAALPLQTVHALRTREVHEKISILHNVLLQSIPNFWCQIQVSIGSLQLLKIPNMHLVISWKFKPQEVKWKRNEKRHKLWAALNCSFKCKPFDSDTSQPSPSHSRLTAAVPLHGDSAVMVPILSCLTPGIPCVWRL